MNESQNLHQNALFIRKWLVMNARYHDLTYQGNEAYDTARHYAQKLDIHDICLVPNGDNPRRPAFSFRIKLGKPRFRGSVSYVLLPHSLQLSTASNNIRILPDYTAPKWYEGLVKSLYGNRRRRSLQRALGYPETGAFSAHPHIGRDGNPCLGGWANAWSSTVSTGNLISLVPVTQSFLNTWTSNDAYWNINHAHTQWTLMPVWARKELPFSTFLAKINLFYNFQNDLEAKRIRMVSFPRWVQRNAEMIQQLVMDGFSLERLFDCYYGSYLKKVIKEDTEERDYYHIQQSMSYIQDIYYLAMQKVRDYLPCSEQMAGALITEAMMGSKSRYIENPWDKGPTRTASHENGHIGELVSSRLRDVSNSQSPNNEYSYHCELSDMLDFSRHIHGKDDTAYSIRSYLNKDDILGSINYYLRHVRAPNSFFEYSQVINSISKMIGIDGQLKTAGSFESKTAEEFLAHMNKFYAWTWHKDNDAYGAKMNDLAYHYAYQALDTYEKLLLTTIKRRTTNGKDKIRPTLHDNHSRAREQQSQISIESF